MNKNFTIFTLIILLAQTTYAQVNYGVSSKVQFKITKTVNQIFRKAAKKQVLEYNQNRFKYKKFVVNEFNLHGIKISRLDKKLPKAFFKNNEIHIPEIGLVLALSNYLDNSFLLKGKKIKVACIAQSECLKDLISKVKSNKYGNNESFISNILFPSAFAKTDFQVNNKRFQVFLDKNDTKVIAAIMSLKGTSSYTTDFDMPIPESCWVMCSKTNAINASNVLREVSVHMERLLENCESISTQYTAYYSDPKEANDYYNDSAINDLIRTVTGDELLADAKQKSFLDKYIKVEQLTALSDADMAKLSCEQQYTISNPETVIHEENEARLNVIKLEIPRLEKIGFSQGANILKLRKRKILLEELKEEKLELEKKIGNSLYNGGKSKFCGLLKEVKLCMGNYYSYKNQHVRVNNNEVLKDLRHKVNTQLGGKPSSSKRE